MEVSRKWSSAELTEYCYKKKSVTMERIQSDDLWCDNISPLNYQVTDTEGILKITLIQAAPILSGSLNSINSLKSREVPLCLGKSFKTLNSAN